MSHQFSKGSTSLHTASQNQLQTCPRNTACLLGHLHNYTFVWFITQQSCGGVYRWLTHRFPVATILRFLWRCLKHDPVPMYLQTEHTAFDVALFQGTCSKLSTRWCTVDFHRHWNTKNLSSKFAKLLKWFLSCIGFQHKKCPWLQCTAYP